MRIRKEFIIVSTVLSSFFAFTFYEPRPIRKLMEWRATRNTSSENSISFSNYQVYDYTGGIDPEVTIDFLKGKHFWNPQVAIWLEDSAGNHLETLVVTTSTAKGLFYTGRSASNFKVNDGEKKAEQTPTSRVDALPYWSHKRDRRYGDGLYSPPPTEPLPDAITGATPQGNFYFQSSANSFQDLPAFKVMVEINVAFDENEYYSEYDFPDDSLYHSGTGLLGQPSLIYGATIRKGDQERYKVLSLLGHGHHSGATGELIADTRTVTTARYVVERIVVGVNEKWFR